MKKYLSKYYLLSTIPMEEKKTPRITKFWLDFFDIISFFVLSLGILLFIRFFIINPFTVVGSSMEPTYSNGDFILVDKISPRFNTYERGDTIIFVPPEQTHPFIKRIIGLPGETIKIKDWKVEICDTTNTCKILKESYIPTETKTLASCGTSEFTIKEWFFVLGDNRWGSTDSRCCFNSLGCIEWKSYEVPENNIIWGIFIRMFPNFWFVK